MRKTKRVFSVLLVMGMLATLAGCGRNTQSPDASQTKAPEDTLVVGTLNFDGKFSPFFYTNSYENDVLGLVHLNLLGTDREGAVVLKGIQGEVRPYNGTDYTYEGIADCQITENEDGTVFYDFTLREGVQFSDGTTVDIDDVIFSLYVPLDPTYDGIMTLYSLPIQGLEAYRSGMETRMNLILKAGPGGYVPTEYYTQEQYDTFWAAFAAAGEAFIRGIMEQLVQNGKNTVEDRVTAFAANWGYTLGPNADMKDFFQAILDTYGYDLSEQGIDKKAGKISMMAALEEQLGDRAEEYHTGISTGESAPNISGIQKTGDRSLRIVMDEVSATAIYTLSTAVVPMHYYGEEALYDYENNQFGFPKGDLSHVRSVTTRPVGGGPYKFMSYQGGTVTLQANERYWKDQPKIQNIQFKEGQDADKVPGVVAGTLDITDPSYSVETAKAISQANGGKISGDVLHTTMVANLGYGYIGMNANLVNVAGEGGSEASRNLRKAIATVISVYRDVAVDSYYGEYANVINYPISDTSWAAPRVTDEGYRIAFSVDVQGNPIYTRGMTDEEKYAAAKNAALGFFAAAGYTVSEGRVTAAPQGAAMSYEVLVGAGGTGDHPTFMALSMASEALKDIGFNLIVTDISNFSELSNAVNAGTAELFAMAWSATPDPDLYQIYHSEGGSNEKAYWLKDSQLDELIMMARQSTDQTYRKTLYKECLEIIGDWAVEIPVYQRQNVVIFSPQRVNMDTVTPDMTTFWGWENDIERLELK